MNAHAKLLAADAAGKNTSTNWSAFRRGDYASAASGI
jgi:hypothetical protein